MAVTGVLGFVLARLRGQFSTALRSAPIALLLLAMLLQILALLARSGVWNICLRAAGGTVTRRLLFRAAGAGYLASLVNGSVGMAARVRFPAPRRPRERSSCAGSADSGGSDRYRRSCAAAIFSFTLIAPLGAPRWVPVSTVAVMAGAVAGLRRVSKRHRTGLWARLAVVRNKGRGRVIAFTILAVCAQGARNWLMLHTIGVNVSVFDAMAC